MLPVLSRWSENITGVLYDNMSCPCNLLQKVGMIYCLHIKLQGKVVGKKFIVLKKLCSISLEICPRAITYFEIRHLKYGIKWY